MSRRLISSGSTFERDIGFSRAVVDGEWVFVSGTTGFDYATMTIADDVVAQSRLAWANLTAQLRAAGMTLDNVVKVVTILPNAADLAASRTARQEALGDRRPASTLIIGGLANPAWKIEVEAVAVA